MRTSEDRDRFILVAVADPIAHPEAIHIAAATGHPVVDATDDRAAAEHAQAMLRYLARAAAVIIDAPAADRFAEAAELVEGQALQARGEVFAVAADPGPAPRLSIGHTQCVGFVIPAQSPELLAAVGASVARRKEAERAVAGDSRRHRAGRDGYRGAPIALVVGFLGAGGGAGTSTLAVAVARHAARDKAVALVDAAPDSGGLDLLVGCEDRPGAHWEDLDFTHGEVPGEDLLAALPKTREKLAVLCATRSALTAHSPVDAAGLICAVRSLRAAAQVVVLDLPSTGPLVGAGVDVCDLVIVVVPAEVRAAAAAVRMCARLNARRTRSRVVVRHRQWSSLSVADVESLVDAPVIAELPTVRGVARQAELGGLSRLPRGLSRVAELVLDDVAGAAG